MRNGSNVVLLWKVLKWNFSLRKFNRHTQKLSAERRKIISCVHPMKLNIYCAAARATTHRSALPTVYFGVRWRWCLRQLETCSYSSFTDIYIQYISASTKFFRITSVIYINYARVSESCIISSAPTFPEPLLKFLSSFEPSASYPEETSSRKWREIQLKIVLWHLIGKWQEEDTWIGAE